MHTTYKFERRKEKKIKSPSKILLYYSLPKTIRDLYFLACLTT